MDIVEELRQNRESGARRLVGEYKAGLMSLARRFYKNETDAEELVNATFAKVVENIDDYLEQSAFFGWMCQILTNEFRESVRRKSNKMEIYPGIVPDVEDEDAQEAIYRNLDASLLRDAIRQLPEDIRKTVVLHYFMEMPVREVARVLSTPTGTVAWRLHCARDILAAKLGVAADKAKEAAKKPGVKATLAIIALCALTALGAAGIARWGELSERAAAILGSGGVVPRAAANGETGETGETSGYSTPMPVPPDSPVPPVPAVPFVPDVPSTTLSSGDLTMNKTTRTAALGAASALALASAPPAASADGYQYLIGPAGWTLETATLEGTDAARSTPPGALDVREHVVARSRAMSLTSIKNGATVISIR